MANTITLSTAVDCLYQRCFTDIMRNIHGPAVTYHYNEKSKRLRLSVDVVCCVRCLTWPPQAADWPTDTETTAGQTHQLLIVLSAMDVMWFMWHIVCVDNMK